MIRIHIMNARRHANELEAYVRDLEGMLGQFGVKIPLEFTMHVKNACCTLRTLSISAERLADIAEALTRDQARETRRKIHEDRST